MWRFPFANDVTSNASANLRVGARAALADGAPEEADDATGARVVAPSDPLDEERSSPAEPHPTTTRAASADLRSTAAL